MTDKNGIEIQTGMVVEITGGYFASDNGFYFVTFAPGDPTWTGDRLSLHRVSKAGKLCYSGSYLGSWPIAVTVSGYKKQLDAKVWNAEHAQIEVSNVKDFSQIRAYFREMADMCKAQEESYFKLYGEKSPLTEFARNFHRHYEKIVASI